MNYIIKDPNYLAHHGVAGQKWGVRNAEWYPISAWEAHLRNTGRTIKKAAASAGTTIKKTSASVGDSVKNTAQAIKKRHEARVEAKKVAAAERAKSIRDAAVKNNDVKYMREHKSDFTNEEINKAIERHNTEGRLDSSTKDVFRSKDIKEAIQKGDIKYAQAHRDKLTEDEINQVIARYNTNTKLQSLVDAQSESKQAKIDKLLKDVDNVTQIANKGTNLWNAVVPIVNTITGAELPKIGDKVKDGITGITEVYENGRLISKQTKSTEKGVQKSKTEKWVKEEEEEEDDDDSSDTNSTQEQKPTDSRTSSKGVFVDKWAKEDSKAETKNNTTAETKNDSKANTKNKSKAERLNWDDIVDERPSKSSDASSSRSKDDTIIDGVFREIKSERVWPPTSTSTGLTVPVSRYSNTSTSSDSSAGRFITQNSTLLLEDFSKRK